MEDTQALILTELQQLRADYNEHSRKTAERLSALETSMKTLTGNGQPGRITLLEQTVAKLDRWKVWIGGAAAGVSGVVTLIFHLFIKK